MFAVLERQGLRPRHIPDPQGAIKMREKRTTARRLPSQVIAKAISLYPQKHQAVLTGEMLCCRLGRLIDSREMDIPIGKVHGRAKALPVAAQRLPFIFAENL